MKPDNPIILALDYAELEDARQILAKVRPNIGMIKIGLELFTAYGRETLELSREFNVPIFLDLKLNDVPTTVAKTTEVICSKLSPFYGQHFLSIHCNGGMEMCQAALKVSNGSNVTIAGVTVLTSLDESDFGEIGFRDCRPAYRTIDLAYLGADCLNEKYVYDAQRKRVFSGLTTLICAPTQVSLLRQHLGDDINIITPGIRADADDPHDHVRSKPASFALKNGASWIVVGRPITSAADPVAASSYFREQAERAKHG
jgi:orotidine-5'-phosphate decarboxylase